ncbi:MAG: CheR family methyltransferase [Janthinobacterium lividum]
MTDSVTQQNTTTVRHDIGTGRLPFPVVGIGAAAGGLAALADFFSSLPDHGGMAYVVILHLPSRQAHSQAQPQLHPHHVLQAQQHNARALVQDLTSMPVTEVHGTARIEAGQVYLLAPGKQLAMVDGFLAAQDTTAPLGEHAAIDFFFRSLAAVHRERAVAIVLSGLGSDGAVGISSIREQGGVTLVQAPQDCQHDGMPNAAIQSGSIDFILPAAAMGQTLAGLRDNAERIGLPLLEDDNDDNAMMAQRASLDGLDGLGSIGAGNLEETLTLLLDGLFKATGHDFRHYKRATVLRRIERRMQVRSVFTLAEYHAVLARDETEYQALLGDMLISVTNFFRDRESFDALENNIIAELFKDKLPADEIRVWVAACASGEEAYSMAMLLAGHAATMKAAPPFQVFASDIDAQAIKRARAGSYPSAILADVTPARLRQYFIKDADQYTIRKSVRDRVLFAEHNVLRDPPFSRLDMISCRNLLIYLNRDVQVKVLEMFHFALKPGGYLFLGGSESAESVQQFFTPVDKKNRIYRARPALQNGGYSSRMLSSMSQLAPTLTPRHIARPVSLADMHQRALSRLPPPSVLLDRELNIVHLSEHALPFMRMSGGEPSRQLLALVLPELRLELRSALMQSSNRMRCDCRPVIIDRSGRRCKVNMSILPHDDADSGEEFSLVLFDEAVQDAAMFVPAPAPVTQADRLLLVQLEAELERAKEHLQETIEHAEVSGEEARALIQELQAVNEEMRSATNELENGKEELQSVNEELITVNYELKIRVEETGKANDDLNNLIASTDIATIFVDSALRIMRYTPRAADIFKVIAADVGRPLLDLVHLLDYEQLADDVRTTFDTLRLVEREVRSSNGRHYIVRLLPYRTTEDRIEGAVLTFFDISARRSAEEQLRMREMRMRLVAESTKDYAIITSDVNGLTTSWNKGAERAFGYTEDEMLGQPLACLFVPEDRQIGMPEDEMRRAREDGRAEDERWHLCKDGSRIYCSGVMTPLGPAAMHGYAKIARDQTDRKKNESKLNEALDSEQKKSTEAESAVALKDEFLAIMSHELRHPLNLIQINAELLSRLSVSHSETAQRAATIIKSAVKSQAKIIDDLLDMSRVRTGKLTLALAPLAIGPLLETTAAVVRADPAAQEHRIIVRGAGNQACVMADAVRIEQVLMNLLVNAVKFTPAGGTVTLDLTDDGSELRIEVADTGQGISPTLLPNVFDMFAQSSSVTTRAKGGLGIGLALVKEIVLQHGGRVQAASDGIGQGARFSIWLPLAGATQENADTTAGTKTDIAGLRILLVDDVRDVVDCVQLLLEMEGAILTVATSAEEGLAALAHQEIDLLISDLSMPGIDGHEFLRRARLMPRYQALPAIAVSGLMRDKDVAQSNAAGFMAHLSKPVAMDRLLEIVSRHFGQ